MPQFNITVTKNLSNLNKLTKNIQSDTLSKSAANAFVTRIKQAINQRASFPSGELSKSIKSLRHGDSSSYGVTGLYYYWYANYGRRPGNPPGKKVKKIDAWASRAGMKGKSLRQHIAVYGTHKLLFHEVAKKLFKVDKPRIYKQLFK